MSENVFVGWFSALMPYIGGGIIFGVILMAIIEYRDKRVRKAQVTEE